MGAATDALAEAEAALFASSFLVHANISTHAVAKISRLTRLHPIAL